MNEVNEQLNKKSKVATNEVLIKSFFLHRIWVVFLLLGVLTFSLYFNFGSNFIDAIYEYNRAEARALIVSVENDYSIYEEWNEGATLNKDIQLMRKYDSTFEYAWEQFFTSSDVVLFVIMLLLFAGIGVGVGRIFYRKAKQLQIKNGVITFYADDKIKRLKYVDLIAIREKPFLKGFSLVTVKGVYSFCGITESKEIVEQLTFKLSNSAFAYNSGEFEKRIIHSKPISIKKLCVLVLIVSIAITVVCELYFEYDHLSEAYHSAKEALAFRDNSDLDISELKECASAMKNRQYNRYTNAIYYLCHVIYINAEETILPSLAICLVLGFAAVIFIKINQREVLVTEKNIYIFKNVITQKIVKPVAYSNNVNINKLIRGVTINLEDSSIKCYGMKNQYDIYTVLKGI